MTALFTVDDLADYLHRDPAGMDGAGVDMAERMVWGWLKPVLGLNDRPDPVPDDVFSWAIELGAIAYENRSGGGAQTLGSLSVEFPTDRRDAILEQAGTYTVLAPRGSFPEAARFPDPARW